MGQQESPGGDRARGWGSRGGPNSCSARPWSALALGALDRADAKSDKLRLRGKPKFKLLVDKDIF